MSSLTYQITDLRASNDNVFRDIYHAGVSGLYLLNDLVRKIQTQVCFRVTICIDLQHIWKLNHPSMSDKGSFFDSVSFVTKYDSLIAGSS